ncbi:MAG: SDR family NAD(P)-dependent oxidoreductase [Anaerolineales bacterium]|nr:SDR family NAD(P)-dependent oxidoreductase [Anaerolineales bacterium]
MNLAGKTALITGGAIRVGRAITLALAEAGCDVFIHYGRSAQPAQQTKQDAIEKGVRAVTCHANLADAEAVATIIPTAVSHFGHIDILVNNAAIFPEEDTFENSDADLWKKLFAINLRAPFFLSQAFTQQLPKDKSGKIINILDARLRNHQPDHFVYRLTKGGLWQMTTTMAHAVAPRITVNGVALGAILPPPGADLSYLEKIAHERVPLQRYGSAEIVATNVLHLLRQDFLTGVIIPLDGGEFL